jgi:oxygen-independent coproporphyrinogen-3 oxidase
LDEYLDAVSRSIDLHPAAPCERPPTTVHFGGGTPLVLGSRRFRRLTERLRAAFGDCPSCEWAVETTTLTVGPEAVALFEELRFRRVHLGIQTLDDSIRSRIGRAETGATAVEKIEALIDHGLLVSVDLIIGLDGSSPATVASDLERLYDAGVRMFSVCELRLRREPGRHEPGELERNRDQWRTIWNFMRDHALAPIHLGQFGRGFEDNLYYTHPRRREHCIAIGPYAHGSAGNLYYGNKLLPSFCDALRAGESPIEFGVVYDEHVQLVRTLESELLAHRISPATLASVSSTYANAFEAILAFWLNERLLVPTEECLGLSQEGSWFVGNMISQARQMAETIR